MISWFRVLGILSLLAGASLFLLVVANAPARARGGRDISGIWVEGAVFLVLGMGLLFHQRWAAILLALGGAGMGMFLIIGSLVKGVAPVGLMFNTAYGVAFFIPLAIVVRYWKLLR